MAIPRVQPLMLTDQELATLQPIIQRYHNPSMHNMTTSCTSGLIVQLIEAPPTAVWPFVRAFDRPQAYKHFIRSCDVMEGDGTSVGSIRHVTVVSGLPASTSVERLEVMDDENRVMSFRVLGGEHRLRDYVSVTSVNELVRVNCSRVCSVVLESYVVAIPDGNTLEDTRLFVDTIVRLNLQKLRDVVMAASNNCLHSSNNGHEDQLRSLRI